MKDTFGQSVSITLAGESHGPAIVTILSGMAPGIPVDEEFIAKQLTKRRPSGAISTARQENFRSYFSAILMILSANSGSHKVEREKLMVYLYGSLTLLSLEIHLQFFSKI